MLAEDISDGESKSSSDSASSLSDFLVNEVDEQDISDWIISGSDTHIPYQHTLKDTDNIEYF